MRRGDEGHVASQTISDQLSTIQPFNHSIINPSTHEEEEEENIPESVRCVENQKVKRSKSQKSISPSFFLFPFRPSSIKIR